ncbi:hypothetical protein M5D96_007068 [Drosophila gunungcola]|uniref:Uncharacterized protein n=2 Tax=Drosophila gunungcola TaxID=103775 RepID=A0A9P9YMC7_9MUSC|nr:hypothetical protein M5D96_007068 [Drosophila gunungcola]
MSNNVTSEMAERRMSTSPYYEINKETTGEQLSQTTMSSSEVDVAKTPTSTSPSITYEDLLYYDNNKSPVPDQFNSDLFDVSSQIEKKVAE